MENAFAQPAQAVLNNFQVDPKAGLTDEQVTKLRAKHGKNGTSTEGLETVSVACAEPSTQHTLFLGLCKLC